MRDPSDDERLHAARLDHALRVARVVSDAFESPPEGGETPVPTALRNLLDAIDAVAPRRHDGEQEGPLSEEERDFVVSTGVPVNVFSDFAGQQAEDWLLWSALRDHAVHIRLDQLSEHSALLIVPDLHRVIDAFPLGYTDLDKFRFLRRPDERLDGLSPLQWLLLGRRRDPVAKIITDLNWMP